jgi:hypothetical protein
VQNTKFKNQEDFYRQIKLTSLNDDPIGLLSNIYDDEYPHPVFDPQNICFRRYRNYNHQQYADRKSIKENVRTVFEDIEMYLPGVGDSWHNLSFDQKKNPLTEHDFVVTSCVTDRDHLWPVPYVYNNYHFVMTHMVNRNKKILKPTNRPFFADVLLGTIKPHRKLFFELMQQNNMLEGNIINLFGIYKSKFLNSVKDPQQAIIDHVQKNEFPNTTELLNNTFVSQHISETIMENSWVSVVGETSPVNGCFFVTEKTAKPLMAGRPFIMLGGANYLKQLRQLGFKTFSPVIDESYDEIPDLETRVVSAFNSFKKLATQDPSEITQKLLPILQHNQEIMYKKSTLTRSARNFLDDLHTRYAYKDRTTP